MEITTLKTLKEGRGKSLRRIGAGPTRLDFKNFSRGLFAIKLAAQESGLVIANIESYDDELHIRTSNYDKTQITSLVLSCFPLLPKGFYGVKLLTGRPEAVFRNPEIIEWEPKTQELKLKRKNQLGTIILTEKDVPTILDPFLDISYDVKCFVPNVHLGNIRRTIKNTGRDYYIEFSITDDGISTILNAEAKPLGFKTSDVSFLFPGVQLAELFAKEGIDVNEVRGTYSANLLFNFLKLTRGMGLKVIEMRFSRNGPLLLRGYTESAEIAVLTAPFLN